MAQKSDVIVQDVLHKNETKNSDMLEIMKTTQSYLGDFSSTVLSGRDQLTCERQRCSQQHMMDSNTQSDRLELLEPQVEDWHTLQCFLMVKYHAYNTSMGYHYIIRLKHLAGVHVTWVISDSMLIRPLLQIRPCLHFQMTWKALFACSSRDHGTLGHLFSQLGQLPTAKVPKKDFHACYDALLTVFKGHIISSACKVLEIERPDADIPHAKSLMKQSIEDQRAFLFGVSTQVAKTCSIISD